MDKITIKQVITSQAEQEALATALIPRESYQKIERFIPVPQVIILTGVRRCGKSTWLRSVRQTATESDYFLNFDDERLSTFQLEDCQKLVEAFAELYGIQKTFYFDEMQSLAGWERFVRRLHNGGAKIFVTGSNANLLSDEYGTHLTGRCIALQLFPFSFSEYIQKQDAHLLKETNFIYSKTIMLKKYFLEYKIKGGFPEYLHSNQKEYLHQLYENILYKDIIVKNRIENIAAIKLLIYYLASNNTKEFTYNSLRKLLTLSNARTVADYCHYLENCFLCFTLTRFAYSVRKQAFSPKKIYFIDQALAECIGFRFSDDRGRTLENIVFLELKRRHQYQNIYYHKEKKECDFVIQDGFPITQAIQVCENLFDQKTKKHEMEGLLDALETYELDRGLIITEDEQGEETMEYHDKKYIIEIIPAWRWLLT